MWSLLNISAQNFMSFKEINFSFENKCYIVRATNHDNDGQQSNGGGKTSFIDIIGVLLLGYSLTGRNVKDCVNWGSDDSKFTVSGLLSNPVHNLECYIERTIYTGSKSQELVLLVNGQTPKTLPTKKGVQGGVDVRLGNAYILSDILNIDQDDLLNYYLISRSHYTPFLSANTDRKLEVIARFSKADVVDRAISTLKTDLEVSNDSIQEYQLQIAKIDGSIEGLKSSSSQDREKEFESNKQQRIKLIQDSINQLNERLLLLDDHALDLARQIENIHIVPYDTNQDNELKQALSESKNELSDVLKVKRETAELITLIQNHLAGLITCPKCEHQFSLDGQQYTQTDLASTQAALTELTQLENHWRTTIDQVEASQRELLRIKQDNQNKQRQISSLEQSLSSNQSDQENILKRIVQEEQSLEKVIQSQFEDDREHVLSLIKEKEGEKQAQVDQLNQEKINFATLEQWIDNFNDFKFFLGNKPIETICALVNEYLKLNGSDLNLYIEGVKKLRSGELRQALTPVIYRNWANPQQFVQFSEGERVRLNLSVDLAFQHLINSSSKYGGLNLYVNDELASGLDSLGVKNAANAFNQLNKTILLVTHSGADMVYENTIEIEKKDGVSTIKQTRD